MFAKGMSFWDVRGGIGDADVQLSLVRRPLKFIANNLSFRIELVIRGYLPVRIILDEATFIRRFECFHLKDLIIINKCFMTVVTVAYMNMNAVL